MPSTYLVVPFAEKDRAKALGARWDAEARQWYVPAGTEISLFSAWLPPAPSSMLAPASPSQDLVAVASGALASPRGISLSQLLGGVTKAVADAFGQGVWTRAEVLNVSVKGSIVYLDLTERDAEGRVLAKALGLVWPRTAERILPEFERNTGAHLAPGIKVLLLAKPTFKAQYGLSLEIEGIDPSYTLGDLEAQKRRIREQLIREDLFEQNRRLPAPWDFTRVLVVSPAQAAGLGDFAAEANRLYRHGVCEFVYRHSRFQGAGAAAEILTALRQVIEHDGSPPFDAVIIIRGGGAANDLAWLNDYALARFICTCGIPVLTGIGHERDSTVLDEVAHRSFDTPSKVIAEIERHVAGRARDAREAHAAVLRDVQRKVERVRIAAERADAVVRDAARETVVSAHRKADALMGRTQVTALRRLNEARVSGTGLMRDIRDGARQHLRDAVHAVPAAMASVKELSMAALRTTRAEVKASACTVLDQVDMQAEHAQHNVDATTRVLAERAQGAIARAKAGSEAYFREITSQGPEKTLTRGFAIVKSPDGKPLTSARSAGAAGGLVLVFKDGTLPATVTKARRNSKGEGDGQ